MRTLRSFEVSLWVILVHWYALGLLVFFEYTHAGSGWLADLPLDYWFEELVDGLGGGKLSAGTLLLFLLYALITVSAVVLTYIFAKISVHALSELYRKRKNGLKSSDAQSLTSASVAAIPTFADVAEVAEVEDTDIRAFLIERPELEARIENFRSQMRKVSGISG